MRVGNYTLVQVLGRGGTSEVYAATRASGEPVAIKLLRPQAALDPEVRDAFVAEGVRTRELEHPNIVGVLDVGHDGDTCYLVMERVEGETLAARLAREHRIDEPALRELAAAIADGMQAAHARGVVHRDLKPGNVMMRGDQPVIVDFGIAKSLGAATAAHTERRVGTVAYMAPEQLTDGLITPAVDIWALGVILYEAATGQLPFGNFNDGRLPQLFDTPPRAGTLAPLSPALDRLIARCLERDPGKRPASMGEIARALRESAGDGDERVTEDIGGPPLATVAALAAPAAPRKQRWPLIVGGVVAGMAATALVLVSSETPREIPSTTEPAAAPPVATPTVDAGVPGVEEAKPSAVERKRARAKPPEPPSSKPPPAKPPPAKRKTSQGETLD